MIRAILVVGWAGVLLLIGTGVIGHGVNDDDTVRRHMIAGLLACAALVFADLTLLIYMQGTLRVVRRTAAELELSPGWLREYQALARRGTLWAALPLLLVVGAFASGYPTFTQRLEPSAHLAIFLAALGVQVATLWIAGGLLRRGEQRLAAMGRTVEEGQAGGAAGSGILRA